MLPRLSARAPRPRYNKDEARGTWQSAVIRGGKSENDFAAGPVVPPREGSFTTSTPWRGAGSRAH